MSHDLSLNEIKKEWHGTLKSYLIGLILSLILTSLSFYLVMTKVLAPQTLIFTLISLAFLQAIIQLIFFLHVGQESKPRWETRAFVVMFLTLLVIIIGTLWIMHDLNIRVMADMDMNPSPKEMRHD